MTIPRTWTIFSFLIFLTVCWCFGGMALIIYICFNYAWWLVIPGMCIYLLGIGLALDFLENH